MLDQVLFRATWLLCSTRSLVGPGDPADLTAAAPAPRRHVQWCDFVLGKPTRVWNWDQRLSKIEKTALAPTPAAIRPACGGVRRGAAAWGLRFSGHSGSGCVGGLGPAAAGVQSTRARLRWR